MRIAVTGANGFIGKNLISRLNSMRNMIVTPITRDTSEASLYEILSQTEFVFHLAGATRTKNVEDFHLHNIQFTKKIIGILEKSALNAPILFTSSIHAESDSSYGKTKLEAEKLISDYGFSNNIKVFIYRLSNVFGKWARPNYSSVVATFCHNISRNIPIEIHDEKIKIRLHFIDDVIDAFTNCILNNMSEIEYFDITLGELANKIRGFSYFKQTIKFPDYHNPFDKYLFSTYTSYLSEDSLSTPLNSKKTDNSEFSEIAKFSNQGQISLNVINSRSIRGNHWHNTKHEKFLVIQGEGIIRLRNLYSNDVFEIKVSGKRLEWIEIQPGFVHNIENVGDNPLLTIMWASEIYDSAKPDTFSEEV
jgi:UDP-2-acetamido-2,6-beta-L-arabino-hexul-4-ose reductase